MVAHFKYLWRLKSVWRPTIFYGRCLSIVWFLFGYAINCRNYTVRIRVITIFCSWENGRFTLLLQLSLVAIALHWGLLISAFIERGLFLLRASGHVYVDLQNQGEQLVTLVYKLKKRFFCAVAWVLRLRYFLLYRGCSLFSPLNYHSSGNNKSLQLRN